MNRPSLSTGSGIHCPRRSSSSQPRTQPTNTELSLCQKDDSTVSRIALVFDPTTSQPNAE